jgi:dsDNA-binding SOS-regulon protein
MNQHPSPPRPREQRNADLIAAAHHAAARKRPGAAPCTDEFRNAASSYLETTPSSRRRVRKGARAMTFMQKATADRTYEQAVAAMGHAARALYNAEVALHDARQTHVDQWIVAAQDHLHLAVAEHSAAAARVSCLRDQALAA